MQITTQAGGQNEILLKSKSVAIISIVNGHIFYTTIYHRDATKPNNRFFSIYGDFHAPANRPALEHRQHGQQSPTTTLEKSANLYSGGLLFALLYSSSFGFAVSAPIEILVYLIPLHLASMFFMFYALWFTAKQFTSLQKQEKVTFFEYSGPFFMLWLFPIGVWFIQPKVNLLLAEEDE